MEAITRPTTGNLEQTSNIDPHLFAVAADEGQYGELSLDVVCDRKVFRMGSLDGASGHGSQAIQFTLDVRLFRFGTYLRPTVALAPSRVARFGVRASFMLHGCADNAGARAAGKPV
jgi:hypothetical protein